MNIRPFAALFEGSPILFAAVVVAVMVVTGAILGWATDVLLRALGVCDAGARADEG